jgi:hypothetical protein
MAGLEDLIASNPALASIARAVGMKRQQFYPAELPRDMRKVDTSFDPLGTLPRSTLPTDYPNSVKAYRADPKNRSKSNTGIETMPISRFDVGGDWVHKQNTDPAKSTVYTDPVKANQELYRYARLAGAAEKEGYPSLSANELAAFALKEGRSDLGFNGGDYGVRGSNFSNKMYNELQSKYNAHPTDLGFITHIAEKKRVADKLGIPFAHAWNGTGKNAAGQTGADYAKDWEYHREAAARPENKPLMDWIQRGIDDGKRFGLPLKENQMQDTISSWKDVSYKKGGLVDKSTKGGEKLI